MKPTTRNLNRLPYVDITQGNAAFQRGLSLVELMISITIGLLILVALSTLFVNQSKMRSELDKSNRMIDNGRYALEILAGDLRLAGYYGDFSPSSGVPAIPGSLPNPCSTAATDIAAALQLAVQGYNASGLASQIASPPCSLVYTTGAALELKPGSDILVIRRVSTALPTEQADAQTDRHYLQASLCPYDTVTTYKVDNIKNNFTLRTDACTPDSTTPYAPLRSMVVRVYFVSPNSNINPADSIPTLKMLELDASNGFVVRPLVEGVDFMQLEYGLDTTGDGIPDSYSTAPGDTQWPDVVAVKINLLARNNEPTKNFVDNKTYSLGLAGTVTPGDAYKRHAYTQFVRIVNVAGRREIP